jgi:hypothetical protein
MKTGYYNEKFCSIEHYKNYPQMIPFIGENWEKDRKLLLIGESHFSINAPENNFITNWYKKKQNDFSQDIIDKTSTAEIIMGGIKNNFNFKHNLIYSAINAVVTQTTNNKLNISFFSFVNFFQRPVRNKNEQFNKIDDAIGSLTLNKVINIIHPEYLFFLSSKAWEGFSIDYDNKETVQLYNQDKIGYSCHPTCPWWNRESKENSLSKKMNGKIFTGRYVFEDFIKSIT